MTRHIYIDVGAYDGDSIKYFMTARRGLPVAADEFELYAFEPNPAFAKKLGRLQKRYPNLLTVSTDAAWVADGTHEFALDQSKTPLGSTLMASKHDIWNANPIVTVTTFDLDAFIRQFAGDYIIVKMDIEGAEFPICEKLLATGTIELIAQLWVELHPNKVTEYTTTDKLRLMKQLRRRTYFEEWH